MNDLTMPFLPSEPIRHYLDNALAANTRKAYRTDLEHYRAWGGAIPTMPEVVASYLTAYASVLSIATLQRRIVSIGKAHTMQGFLDPTKDGLVRLTLRGIARVHGRSQKQATALMRDDLLLVLSAIPDDLRGVRDKALLLVGFCAALRRSELVALKCTDLKFTSEGLVITLTRSKTDQTGQGREIGIPLGRGKICPVQSLKVWLERSSIVSGYLFRRLERGMAVDAHLSDRTVANIVKTRVASVGLPAEKFSGHSLRSGLASSAAQNGVSSWRIREQTGHRTDAALARYIRTGTMFQGNAADLF